MANYLGNFFVGYLATALAAGTAASSVVLDRITTLTGETLETADLSVLGRGVLTVNPDGDGVTSYPESISFTGVTAATKTLTGAVRGLDKAGTTTTAYMRYHPVGTPVIVSFGVHQISDLITYLNTLVVSTRSVIVTGSAGETLVAGNLVYFDDTDNEWKKCDADTAATVENTMLGIAQGAGVDGGTITTGVLLLGKDLTNSGLTAGQKYFASNTAGGISTSAGTKEVSIGFGSVDGYLYFEPRFDQALTEDEQDALAGSEGTPSATNKFVTALGFQKGIGVYAASAVGSDSYAITVSPAVAAYVTGMKFRFLADVANTGAATLAVSGLSALAIKKLNDQDLETGDIEAGQIVEVAYDGTDFQMQSQTATASAPASTKVSLTAGETINASSTPQAVYIKASDSKVWLADTDADESTFKFIGFVGGSQNVSADAAVAVTVSGVVTGFTGLTTGNYMYLSATAGTLGTTPVASQGLEVALAVSTTSVLIIPSGLRMASISASRATAGTTTVTVGFRPRLMVGVVKTGGTNDGDPDVIGFFFWTDTLQSGYIAGKDRSWGLTNGASYEVSSTGRVVDDNANTDSNDGILNNVTATGFDLVTTHASGGNLVQIDCVAIA